MPELHDILRQHPYFKDIDEQIIDRITEAAIRRTFVADEVIFLEGEWPPKGMWIIHDGQVKVFVTNPDGDEYVLHIFGSGDSFNDIAAFDFGPNPASSAALSAATIWLIPSDTLDMVLREYPEMAIAVIKGVSVRFREMIQQLETLALYSVTTRLARFLVEQSENPTLQGPGINRITIAAHLNVAPETISRALRKLEDAGILVADRTRVNIVRDDLLRLAADLN